MHVTNKRNFRMTAVGLATLAALGFATQPAARAQAYTLNTLATFNGNNGSQPVASLALSGNTLYGTTYGGGASQDGTVFSVPTSGGATTTLANFNGNNGYGPSASLTLTGSTLYGTTSHGGTANGTIFSVPVGGGTPTTLVNFSGNNGQFPSAGLILSGDSKTFYGTAQSGGTSNNGVIFSVPIGGGTSTTLVQFTGANGYYPSGGVTLSADGSTLYGTTSGSQFGFGTVFSVPVSGGAPTTLVTFSGNSGSNLGAGSIAGLTLIGGTLYGTTQYGGTFGFGTVFSIPAAGGSLTTLASFSGTSGTSLGANPQAGLTLVGSTLYGTTLGGGINGDGTVFSIPVAGGSLTTLVNFNGSNGLAPASGLTLGANGILYGTTSGAGTSGTATAYPYGSVFSLTPSPEPSQFVALGIGILSLAGLTLRVRCHKADTV